MYENNPLYVYPNPTPSVYNYMYMMQATGSILNPTSGSINIPLHLSSGSELVSTSDGTIYTTGSISFSYNYG